MNQDIKTMDEASLHAYVDGQLGPYEAAEVALWLQDHAEDAARVLAWRSQRTALQSLQAQMLDEPLPAALLQGLRRRRQAANGSAYLGQALAGVAVLGLGLALGWAARAYWAPTQLVARVAAPAFVRDAAIAHAVYLPEKRHPVEVGAEQQEHLLQWLSKRLGQPLHAPLLVDEGFRLIGGRLLPAGETGASGHLARAQFMYESAAGQRLTLYVSVLDPAHADHTAFHLSEQAGGASRSFYWVEGALGYALTGQVSAEQLGRLGQRVYQQLQAPH